MQVTVRPMRPEEAQEVASWHYDGPYAFYDMGEDPEDLRELLTSVESGSYFAALGESGELVGFFEFTHSGDILEIGLGLRPDLTGHGLGAEFVQAGLHFAQKEFGKRRFRLMVAVFNERAIRVYERVGFHRLRTFQHRTNGGEFEFLAMILDPSAVGSTG